MGTIIKALLVIVAAAAAYLCFWPISANPVTWSPPEDAGYTGDFTPNDRLANIELISMAGDYGPEDIAAWGDGDEMMLYVPGHSGKIYTLDPRTLELTALANTGGVPLGMEFDAGGNLIVADAHKGLLSITRTGEVSVLTNEVDGTPIAYADDLAIAPDGVIYFSDASTKFGAADYETPMAASLYELIEHGRTGRMLAYDPAKKKTRVIADNLAFSNGVAISPDGSTLLYLETGEYRVHSMDLATGETKVVLDNLPGFPDNINSGPTLEDGTPTYLMGLVSPRNAFMDDMAGNPFVRRIALRLPSAMRPAATLHSFVAQITAEGDVLQTWQDPAGRLMTTTGGLIPGDGYLYVTSVAAPDLGRVPYP
ncbi:MAG: SMP-30/gluconolactonase/LRE family protein [Pseudomonadota bacterium]